MSTGAESPRPRLVLLQAVGHLIPRAAGTIYKDHSRGRLPWLTRTNPEGRRDANLWVQVETYDGWAASRGLPLLSRQLGQDKEKEACAL